MYESSTVIHGRPYPLAGYSYSNLFVHFEPVGFSERYYASADKKRKDPKDMFEQALADHQKVEKSQEGRWKQKEQPRPYYVHPMDDDQWNQRYVYVKKSSAKKKPKIEIKRIQQNANEERLFHNLAAKGMLSRMKEMVVSVPLQRCQC